VAAGGRGPEQAVRPFLGQRQSSVFSIPSRSAVYAGDYGEACRLAQATSDPPRKVSRQGFGLFAKIREIDALLRLNESLRRRIHESHPEFAFATLNGGRAMELPKKIKGRINPAGMQERLEMLARFDIAPDVLARPRPAGAGDDDVLDACACLLVAERILAGLARPWPDPPGVDNHGLLVAIWA
nr:DUF429 domain-containing protein [Rhizobiaceae bacterium]